MHVVSRPIITLLTAVLALSAAACNKQAGLRTLAPGIDVSPATLDFGPGVVGAEQRIVVSVTNVGSAVLDVQTIGLAEDPNGELKLDGLLTTDCNDVPRTVSTLLQPEQCARFAVLWTPKAVHAAAGQVKVASTDPDHPEVLLPVSGNAKAAKLKVCVLNFAGELVSEQCSRLSDTPVFIPSLDYGVIQPNVAQTRTLRLFNEGDAQLRFDESALAQSSAREFSVGSPQPGILDPGASMDLGVKILAASNGAFRGTLVFVTNDAFQQRVEVPLLAVGQGWKLCIDPIDGLDFGSVPLNQSRTLTFTLKNCGSVDFTIHRLFFGPFAPTTTEFTLPGGALPANDTAFPAGAEYKFDVTYQPTHERVDTASFDFEIVVPALGSDPSQTIVDSKPVVGKGEPPVCNGTRPVAAIKVLRSNNQVVDPTTYQFDPLDRVNLDGVASTQPNGALTYVWRLVSQPAGGTEQLGSPAAVRTSLWLKQAGDYVAELVVKDLACQSSPETVTLHVVPKGALHVELTWPQAYGDVDVHLIGPGGQFFQGYTGGCGFFGLPCGDVYFNYLKPDWGCADASCGTRGGVYPDGNPNNDASLDIDQRWGAGPENITYTVPFDGVFTVGVHYWCARQCTTSSCSNPFGDATAVIRIWVNGILQLTEQKTLKEFDGWNAAKVTITGNGTQIAVASANGTPSRRSEGCIQH